MAVEIPVGRFNLKRWSKTSKNMKCRVSIKVIPIFLYRYSLKIPILVRNKYGTGTGRGFFVLVSRNK